MSQYFPEPIFSGGRAKVKLNSCNYATISDLKSTTGVDTAKFAKKVNLASLKSNVDKSDFDELKIVPSGFSTLRSKVDKLDIGKL